MPFASSQFFLFLIAVTVILEVIADVFFKKKWALGSSTTILVIGMVIYLIDTIICAVSLKYQMLSKAIVFFTVANALVVALIGIYMFREQLSLINKIGIALGAVSLLLIEM